MTLRQTTPDTVGRSRQWWALPVIGLAQLMVVLDATIVNIALPTVQRDLDMSDTNRHWVITAYALAFGGALLLGGRVSGAIGHRRAFALGLSGFVLASVLGGVAVNAEMLFAARALQGIFAALLAPAALSLLTLTFTTPEERGRAFGVFAAVGAAGAAIGVVAGGLLTEYADWRWCLYINIPMGMIALAGSTVLMRDTPMGGLRDLDVVGTALSAGGVVALVYAFAQAEPHGWTDPVVVGLLVAGVLLLAVFVFVEAKLRNPLLPLRILKHPVRGSAFAAIAMMFMSIYGFYLFISYYTQTVLGYSAVTAGMTLLVNAVATIIGSMWIAGKLYGRVAPGHLVAGGMLSASIGIAILTVLRADTADVFPKYLLPALILTGLGLGCVLASATNLVTADTDWSDAGIASGAYNAVQQLGAALGTSLMNTIAAAGAAGYLLTHGNTPETVRIGTVNGYTTALTVAAVVLVVGACIAGVVTTVQNRAARTGQLTSSAATAAVGSESN